MPGQDVAVNPDKWENENGPRGAINTAEGLTTESLIRSE